MRPAGKADFDLLVKAVMEKKRRRTSDSAVSSLHRTETEKTIHPLKLAL